MKEEELMETIRFLQEELKRKNEIIKRLKEENHIIMKTAIKNAQKKT